MLKRNNTIGTGLQLHGYCILGSNRKQDHITLVPLRKADSDRTSKTVHKSFGMGFVALGAMRLIRGWNQTGQKFAGEPDIVTNFVSPYPPFLWYFVAITYAMVSLELFISLRDIPAAFSGSAVAGLATSAVSFKLAFTKEDAPELVIGTAKTLADMFDGPSLVNRARAVYLGLGLALIYPLYSLAMQATKVPKERCKCLYIVRARELSLPTCS